MRDVEGEAVHFSASRNEEQQRAEEAEHQRGAEEIRHAEDPHLGDARLEHGEQDAGDRQLGRDRRRRRRRRSTMLASAMATPHGVKTQPMSDT